jgi:flagellar hook-associated protein 1 FlgK
MTTISSFYGLQTALRGLLAQQQSIDVTGHNIANASTPGFSRQEANLVASPALQVPAGAVSSGAGAYLGSGVDVQSYQRVRDGFLDVQYRAQSMRLGFATSNASTLSNAELALNEPSDNGISAQLTDFWNSWSDLANSPDDPATRSALVQSGKTLADSFSALDSQLSTLQQQASDQYATLTQPGGKVDAIAKELGQLNTSISTAIQAGETPNDLMDRRDQLLDQLSSLGQTSVTAQSDGSVTVAFGDAGSPLVDHGTVTWPQSLTAPGGQLGALKQLSDPGGTLDTYRTNLNAVVKTLADSVNAIHGTPPFFTYTAGSEASTLSVGVTADTIVPGSGTAPGSNDIASAVADLRQGAADGAYRSFVTGIGSDVAGAQRDQATAQALTDSIDNSRASVSGVSLDEEMTNLVKFQRAYQASARAMSTMDDMLDTLVNRTGRVGL